MERLTEHHVDGKGAYMKCSEFCNFEDLDCESCEKSYAIIDRLAAYEDTGLEPEEVYGLCEMEKRSRMAKMLRWEKAERDGRLVVLPLEAKEGDPLPQCFYGDGGLCPGLSAPNDDEPIEMCKRCWYCSVGYRQEDEKEPREAEGGKTGERDGN